MRSVAPYVLGAAIVGAGLYGWQSMYEESLNPALIASAIKGRDSYVLQGACKEYDLTSPSGNFPGTLKQMIDDRRTLVAHTSVNSANISFDRPNSWVHRLLERAGVFHYRATFDEISIAGYLFCPGRIY